MSGNLDGHPGGAVEMTRLLVRHRGMLLRTAWNDVRVRFAGSVVGVGWMVLYPLLFLAAYAVVYLAIFQVRLEMYDAPGYVLLVFCGLVPFFAFAEALGAGVGSVSGNANLLRNTLFPIELAPVKAALAAQPTQVVGTALLLVALAVRGDLTAWALLLPLVWLAQMGMTLGVLWFLSALNVFLRDLQSVVGVMVLLLMMISPIAYTPEMVPERVRGLLSVNPLYHLISCYQDILMHGRAPEASAAWVSGLVAVGLYAGGAWFFLRIKRVFVDHV